MLGMGREQEPFSVTSEQRGHAAHLRMFGEIDMATAPALEGWLQKAESNGNTAIVVDLEQVTFMDASGIRVFLGAAQRATASGRTFGIIRAPAMVQRILQITGTSHLLAADALAPNPGPPPGEAPLRSAGGLPGAPAVPAHKRTVQPAR